MLSNFFKAFIFIPAQGTIESKQEKEIKVIFKPDRVSEKYYSLTVIDVPHQKEEKKLFLYGFCYPRQTFIRYYQPHNVIPNESELKKPIEFPFDILKTKDEENIFSSARNRILMEFAKTKEKIENNENCFLRKLLLGNCKMLDPKMEKNGNYEITMPVFF